MIYVHTYYTGKFNSVKHVRVYDDFSDALAQARVLGGRVIKCVITDEIY